MNKKRKLFYWDNWLELAKAYYAEHGDLLVRSDYITPCGRRLGKWISAQRANKKGTGKYCLTIDQIASLEAIGMVWEVVKRPAAREYAKEHGRLDMTGSYIHPNGEKLGAWVKAQRLNHLNNTLDSEKTKALETLGIVWDTWKERWQSMYCLAKEYFKKHGHLRVPYGYVDSCGESLGVWIYLQRNKSMKNKNLTQLDKQRVKKLKQIGMV